MKWQVRFFETLQALGEGEEVEADYWESDSTFVAFYRYKTPSAEVLPNSINIPKSTLVVAFSKNLVADIRPAGEPDAD